MSLSIREWQLQPDRMMVQIQRDNERLAYVQLVDGAIINSGV